MIHESVRSVSLPKIGFGTWNIGGGSFANRSQDARALAALSSAIELGYTHFDTAEIYAAGHTEELLGRAIRGTGTRRESVFLTSKVSPDHLHFDDVLESCEGSLRRLGTDYLDLYLIHWPGAGMKLPDTFRALNKLVEDHKVHHIGVSNFDLRLLKQARELSLTPILTDQVPYSISDRSYARNGVLTYCQENDILLTAYSPLHAGRLKPSRALAAIAEAHSVTPHQIALAWLVAQRRVTTIPMSQDRTHQKQNLDAASIRLTQDEVAQLT